MTLKEAELLGLTTLKQVMEEKVTATNVEVASITSTGYALYTKEQVHIDTCMHIYMCAYICILLCSMYVCTFVYVTYTY